MLSSRVAKRQLAALASRALSSVCCESIPTIDLKQSTPKQVFDACVNVGFFYLSNHGIEQRQVSKVLQQSKHFFDLPLERKLRVKATVATKYRGYNTFQEETLDPKRQTVGDTKEGYYIGREVSADSDENQLSLQGPNQWPDDQVFQTMEEAHAWRVVMYTYHSDLSRLARDVVDLMGASLSLPSHHFRAPGMFDKPVALLRLLHYTSETSRPSEGVYGAGAHSDYGMLTLLATDEQPGLQIFTKQQKWVDVPPKPGCFIVNLGDMLERWTNDVFRSTLHRVITPAGAKDRYSLPFFFEPNFDCVVECLPTCTGPDRPPKYAPTTSGEHLLSMYEQTHAEFSANAVVGLDMQKL